MWSTWSTCQIRGSCGHLQVDAFGGTLWMDIWCWSPFSLPLLPPFLVLTSFLAFSPPPFFIVAQHAYTVNSHTWIARHRIFGQFTMETILAVVFSHRVGILRGDEDQFTRLSQCILRDGQAAAYFGGGDCSVPVFLSNFPFLEYFVRMYHSCSEAGKSSKMLTDNIIELIKARRAETGQVTYTCTCVPYFIHMLQCCLGPFVGQG